MGGEENESEKRIETWTPILITWLGGLFLLLHVVEQSIFYGVRNLFSANFLVSSSIFVPFIAALLGGGYWLNRADLPGERYLRINKWVLGGMTFFLSINLLIMAITNTGDLPFRSGWARWAANVGAAGGLLFGCAEASAIQRELEAQRAEIRAEEAENQRKWLDYLNGLLRHEVLNTANVITGYSATLLEDADLDDDAEAHLKRIHKQGREMTEVIRDVQVLIEATSDADRLGPKNLADVLDSECRRLRETYECVTVEASIPEDVTVLADDLLPRVFSNLLRNAVEHNDDDHPSIRVTVEEDGDRVRVDIADDGPGVSAAERATLFEQSDNTGRSHGLGLYLVQTLVERYGGSVELTETSPDGSVFTVELSTVDGASDDVLYARRGDSAAGRTR